MPKIIPFKDNIFILDNRHIVKPWNIFIKRFNKEYNYGRVDFNPIRFPKEWIGDEVRITIERITKDEEQPEQTTESKERIEPVHSSNNKSPGKTGNRPTISIRQVSTDDDRTTKNLLGI